MPIPSAATITTTAAIAVGRQARGGGSAMWKSTSISPDRAALISRIRRSEARTFTRASRSAGQAVRGRMRRLELLDLAADVDRRCVALEALAGLVALRDEPLREPGLVEHRAVLGEGRLGDGPRLAGAGERVAVLLQLPQRCLAVPEGGGRGGEIRLCRLDPAGILVALRVELEQRPLQLPPGPAGAAIRARDGGLEPVPERRLVPRQPIELVVPDGRRRAEERLAGDAGQLGQELVRARPDRSRSVRRTPS